jgi:hypothetical protein
MADINATIYRVFLTHNSVQHEARPYGFDEHEMRGRREADSIFLRRFFTGKMIFTDNQKTGFLDYSWIKSIEDGPNNCLEISVRIDRSCDSGLTYSTWWQGYFTTADCEFDLDKCRISVEPRPDDLYRCLLDRGEVPFNIISMPDEYTVTDSGQLLSYEWYVNFGPSSCLILQATGPTDPGWTYVDCDNTTTPPVNYAFFWREYKWTGCVAGLPVSPSGAGWVLDTDDCATTGMAKWVRVPTEPNPIISTDFFFSSTCTDGVPDKPVNTCATVIELVGFNCLGNWSFWWCRPPATTTDYNHTRWLYDVALYVAQNACPEVKDVVSDFFEWNPPGDAPGYVAGKNYVTGLDNQAAHLFLSQKSDILLPTATEPATVGNITFNQLVDMLRIIYNVRWFLIPGEVLRFEHISYFQYSTIADLTVAPFSRILLGTNKYSYLKDRRPKREKFRWMEAYNADFKGADIVYDFACVDPVIGGVRPGQNYAQFQGAENAVTFSADFITTDIDFITNSPSEISSDGFVLLAAEENGVGGLSMIYEEGRITGVLMPNGPLSWANLHYAYHRHDRVLLEGVMNNIQESFLSARRTKAQNEFSVFDCCDGIDESVKNDEVAVLVKTGMGFGMLDEYSLRLKSTELSLKLLY